MKKYLFQFFLISILFSNFSHAEDLAPIEIKGARTVSSATAQLLFDKGYPFIDVRSIDYFKNEHIPGAYHLPLKGEFNEQNLLKIVRKEQPVVIYCNGIACLGSSLASHKAVDWGWTQIFYYREGIQGWKQQDSPVDSLHK